MQSSETTSHPRESEGVVWSHENCVQPNNPNVTYDRQRKLMLAVLAR